MSAVPATISSDALLRIPVDEPERLFSPAEIKAEYLALARRWYRRAASGEREAEDALRHLNALYRSAKEKRDAGRWDAPGTRTLFGTNGAAYTVGVRSCRAFELGEAWIGGDTVVYLVDPAHRDLFEAARRTIAAFTYADDAMRAQLTPRLPALDAAFETAATSTAPARLVAIVRKTPDLLLLDDVLARASGGLDARHAAWILSDLHALACWLQWANLSHGAIALDTVFISPPRHATALLGGWWYAAVLGGRLRALPSRTANAVPSDVLRGARGDARTDLTLIRLLGRELLRDARGGAPGAVPRALATWLRLATCGDAVRDYAEWGGVLTTAFGRRRFTPLELGADDLYP